MTIPVYLNELGLSCALGTGKAAVAEALFAADAPRGVRASERYTPGRSLHLGEATVDRACLDALPPLQRSRNNALLLAALVEIRPAVERAIGRYGAARVAVVLGTSTSGILESEQALQTHAACGALPPAYHYGQQELCAPALMLAQQAGAAGPAYSVSTACSSSAKALASAARLLRTGLVDAVLAGGADSLCGFTIAGFSALESVSAERCNPLSRRRCGINIGEGAGLFLVTREPGPVRLAGWGESSDAHHISAPEPGGRGAVAAMQAALRSAGIAADAVDYLNLHGTATPQNDAMESRAVAQLFGAELACSSTKPLTGHALGAAGAIEAGLAWLTLADNPRGRLPPHWWDGERDPELPLLRVVAPGETLGRAPAYVLSNSFAFGGSNASLLLAQG